ncbi:MAG: VCBS repeat-containing protein, partial [Planctomycetota bacterium]
MSCLTSLVALGGAVGLIVVADNPFVSPPAQPGLILSKSLFDGTEPLPSTLVLLRPSPDPEAEWVEERIVVPAAKVELQGGLLPDGGRVWRAVEDGRAVGPSLTFEVGRPWSVVPTDVNPDHVEWDVMGGGRLGTKGFELEGGNVFHKAVWWEPAGAEPGILTISANMPYLAMFRPTAQGEWRRDVLWTAMVGGKEQRFRDFEIGDVDGDGEREIVLATHDQGGVWVLEVNGDSVTGTEIHRELERTFVHEVELGDLDGNGLLEIYTTPAEPSADGASENRGGGVDCFRFEPDSGAYVRTQVAWFEGRHAKEILVTDITGTREDALVVVVEGRTVLDGDEVVDALIYRDSDRDGRPELDDLIQFNGPMCRFAAVGDLDGNHGPELLFATSKGGVFRARRFDFGWDVARIVPAFASS